MAELGLRCMQKKLVAKAMSSKQLHVKNFQGMNKQVLNDSAL